MKRLLFAALLLAPTWARADEPDLCVDRPGIATPPCTLPLGRVMVEFGALGWDHSSATGTRDDAFTVADTVVRVGLGGSTEVQIGLGGWSHQRSRAGAAIATGRGIGDATFAVRHGFGSEDSAQTAVQAFVTVPVGSAAVSAGDWGGGVLVPIALPLPSGFELDLTPEIDAAVNGSGHGRHLAWGGVIGLAHAVGRAVSIAGELSSYRDDDPDGATTDSRFAVSASWRAGRSLQIDVELDTGLTRGAPDRALMLGFARQF